MLLCIHMCQLFSVISVVLYLFFFFFFKQKPAYEMRISDWSSDVCSSDLDCNSRELLDMIRVLLRAREPLAELLETAIPYLDGHNGVAYPTHVVYALTVARAINAAAEPGPVRGGTIRDRLTGGTT